MIIVGGTYLEECGSPRLAGLLGPGLRAAMAISNVSSVELHTFTGDTELADLELTCSTFNIKLHHRLARGLDSSQTIAFEYINALRPCEISKGVLRKAGRRNKFKVSGKEVLVLGLAEGTPIITADTVVFEPEEEETLQLSEFGIAGRSKAKRLAVIMSAKKFRQRLRRRPLRDAAYRIMSEANARVLVVRSEFGGATVFEDQRTEQLVGPYVTPNWRKLGAGNVFAAVFAHEWAEKGTRVTDAARQACLAAALYNDGASLPLPAAPLLLPDEAPYLRVPIDREDLPTFRVRLEGGHFGGHFSYASRRLLRDAYEGLGELFADVETPVPVSDLNRRPKRLTDQYQALLLLADFADREALAEAQWAASVGKPVIVYSEAGDTTSERIVSPGREFSNDLVTAIYRTVVAARRHAAGTGP